MKITVTLLFVIAVGLIVGCSNSKVAKSNAAVLDVSPAANIPPAEPMLVSAPINDSPAVAFASNTPTPIPSVAVAEKSGSKLYKVKKGDTLFSIAKTQLGSGRDWQKIAAANPGLTPAKLKAGQQIAMP